jgi:hypothetical protein
MANYRCYLLGDTGRIAAVEELEAETDETAIAAAQRVVADRPSWAGFELWELGRRVQVEPLAVS